MPRRVALVLPNLGFAAAAVRASLWLAQRGSMVEAGEPLLEVLAGSATVDLPAPASGVLLKQLVREDDLLAVGQQLAVIEIPDEE